MSDVTDRLDALEARLIAVADLPLAALQRKLEQNWQPDAAVLLQPGSITADLLSRVYRTGSGSAVWTAARDAADETIAHGLGVVPSFVRATSSTVTLEYARISKDATNIVIRGYHTDGTAISGTFDYEWIAFA